MTKARLIPRGWCRWSAAASTSRGRPEVLLALRGVAAVALVAAGLGVEAELSEAQRRQLPSPTGRPIDFVRDIQPLLQGACVKCHGRGKAAGGFSLENRAALLQGGDSGPSVVAGRSAESHLIELVSGLDPDNVMPQKGSRLKPEQVSLLRAWIDQGAPWDPAVSFARMSPRNLTMRRPEMPAARGGVRHPVDRFLQPYYAAHGFKPGRPVEDRVYARRVYLDLLGVLPPAQELARLGRDRRDQEREQLVHRLLSDRVNYASHWLSFWNDLLRNDYTGTGFIDDNRRQITGWLYAALLENRPFDRMVRELVSPVEGAEGFTKGILWRGVVNASMTPEMQAAQNLSQVFMGVNLKCASCHDSFINDWSLADAYGMAAIYSEQPLELVHCDKPTGRTAEPRFLYPELGAIDPTAAKPERLRQLAAILTGDAQGRLARTMVNRLWARFFGRGLVEPVDDMEAAAWHPDLLDWLAADLVDHQYDLQRTMALLVTSRAYQLPAVPLPEQPSKEFVFRGPFVRRLTAEQYADALADWTGNQPTLPANQADLTGVRPDAVDPTIRLSPRWIWTTATAAEKAEPGTVGFRRTWILRAAPAEAALAVTCDNSYRLFVNHQEIGAGGDHTRPGVFDIRARLLPGKNVIAIEATNQKAKPEDPAADQNNPAGLLAFARIRLPIGPNTPAAESIVDLATDAGWQWSTSLSPGWTESDFDSGSWAPAVELGDRDLAPWRLGARFGGAMAATALYGRSRSALHVADPLTTALGRPNREQVHTARASVATTLQALELTNGETLTDLLRRGAARIMETEPSSSRDLVNDLFLRSLGRPPTSAERRLGAELVGSPVRAEGLEDLLWAVAMLPEFQLIP